MCVLQNGPQVWMDEAAGIPPTQVSLFRSMHRHKSFCVPGPSEGPEGIWRRVRWSPF